MAIYQRCDNGADQRTRYQLKSPVTLEDIGSFEACNKADVDAAVARARVAQAKWAELNWQQRGKHLARLRGVLLERMDDIIDTILMETGKPALEAAAEITTACDALQFYPKHAKKYLGETRSRAHLYFPFKHLVTRYQPRGVVGIITPWNFPFAMGMNPGAQALMAGNAVILKPSEVTPFSALLMRDLVAEAGLPSDLFQVIPGDGATGAALIESGIDKVHFTGSVRTGRKVGEACGRLLLPVTLELGGKDVSIVCADANLDRAVPGVINSALFNAGQACASTERIYVAESIADAFTERLVQEVKALRQGSQGEYDVSCMIWDQQLRIVEEQVAAAVADGASVLSGGQRLADEAGLFYAPTVLDNVHADMAVMSQETFGPVLPIQRVADDDEAIQLANASDYGLSASIWCGDKDRGLAIARRLQTGCATVNDFGGLVYGAPEGSFGGRKDSGVGYVNGELGLKSFCQAQHIVVHRFGPAREQSWFPYTQKTLDGIKGFMRFFYSNPIGRWMS